MSQSTRGLDYMGKDSEAIAAPFFRYRAKTVRDPIHGDIPLTGIELNIIDTRDFQRLRHIKQLGTSNLVYPGANHTRFEHSIGTMHMATRMVFAIIENRFSAKDKTFSVQELQFIRIAALLHDLAHVPFGHTIEDEANLFGEGNGQFNNPDRSPQKLIGKDTDIGQAILKGQLDQDSNQYEKWFKEKDLVELQDILSAHYENPKNRVKNKYLLVEDLPRPYIADIVGNTICADLLDYLKRDFYFCGIDGDYDERFMNYMVLEKDKESDKYRVAIRLVGRDTNRYRRDNVSEILNLLRLRYSLSEKVLYHHAKMSSSAMITEAVRRSEMKSEELYHYNDETLMDFLRQNKDEVVQKLIRALDSRKLYKEIYWHSYSSDLGILERDIAAKFFDKDKRSELQGKLEKQSKLDPGSVIVYCPPYNMGLKEAKVRVISKGESSLELEQVTESHIKNELKNIQDNHQSLWRISVFLDQDIINNRRDGIEIARGVAKDAEIRTGIGLNNNNEKYAGGNPFCKRVVKSVIIEHNNSNPDKILSFEEAETLIERYSGDSCTVADAYTSFKNKIEEEIGDILKLRFKT